DMKNSFQIVEERLQVRIVESRHLISDFSIITRAEKESEEGGCSSEIRVYEQEVIVVPILLLASFLITLVFILLLRYCPEKVDRIRPRKTVTTRRILQGIDGKWSKKC
ncbi:hypothetical protein XENOCAPTIV_010729, partial [Xenoophorus captivus]